MSNRSHEVTTPQSLLNAKGDIAEPGWARGQVQRYRRADITAPSWRIKEWDYYLVLNEDFAACFTVSDLGYMGMLSASFLDFKEPFEHTESILTPFPMGKFKMPESSAAGDVAYEDNRLSLRYTVTEGKRRIQCSFKKFHGDKDLTADILLDQPKMDSMVIATPWDKPKHFYYNEKINCMPASGWVQYGERRCEFDPATDFGTLDWGRGVWTYDNTWYWGSGNAMVNGKPFGFNIGYGFGNTAAATENVLFYDGKAHKLDDVTFHIPADDFCKPWTFTSSDGRFEMDFQPILDRCALTDVKLIISDQHQVFGKLSGTAVLDDGTKLELKDVVCFAEKVRNRY